MSAVISTLSLAEVVSGVSNVLPKEDAVAKKLAEHEKALALAENDAKAALGSDEEEGI